MGPIIFWLQNFRQMRNLVIFISMETIYPKYEKDSRKILTAALGLSDIFIKFLEIYHIRYSSENNELKLLCKMSNFKLYIYIPYKALREFIEI